jgi:hypothetical protein
MEKSILDSIREGLEQPDMKKAEKNYTRRYWKWAAVLFLMAVTVVGTSSRRGQHIIGHLVGFGVVSSQSPIKQVKAEEEQVPRPGVQTEGVKTDPLPIIQPEESKNMEDFFPEEEMSLNPINVKEGVRLGAVEAKEDAASIRTEENQIISFVESWRRAWSGKRLDDYITHYHPAFKSNGKDLAAWKRHKEKLNDRYRFILVKVSDLNIEVESRKAWAYFIQGYHCDVFSEYGYKLIEFRKDGDSWKIYQEKSYGKKTSYKAKT